MDPGGLTNLVVHHTEDTEQAQVQMLDCHILPTPHPRQYVLSDLEELEIMMQKYTKLCLEPAQTCKQRV